MPCRVALTVILRAPKVKPHSPAMAAARLKAAGPSAVGFSRQGDDHGRLRLSPGRREELPQGQSRVLVTLVAAASLLAMFQPASEISLL